MKKRLYFILAGENLFHPQYLLNILRLLDLQEYQVVGITLAQEKTGVIHQLARQYQLWGWLGFIAIGIKSSLKCRPEMLWLGD